MNTNAAETSCALMNRKKASLKGRLLCGTIANLVKISLLVVVQFQLAYGLIFCGLYLDIGCKERIDFIVAILCDVPGTIGRTESRAAYFRILVD